MTGLRAAVWVAIAVLAGAMVLTVAPTRALAADVRVSITDRLEPANVTVSIGTAVTWTNDDDGRHRVRSRDGASEFDSGNLEPGESFTFVFEVAGDHPYRDERDPDDPAYHGSVRVTAEGGTSGGTGGGGADAGAASGGSGTDGGGSGTVGGGPASGQLDVAILDRSFSPASVDVAAGSTVTWTNRSDREHTVTFTEGGGSGELGNGGTFSRTFDAPGTFEYLCAIHPEMTGRVTVAGGSPEGTGTDAGANGGTVDGGTTQDGPSAGATTDGADGSDRTDVGSTPDSGPTPSSGSVRIVDLDFEPPTITVAPGATVTWNNEGAAPHTVTGAGFDSGVIASGGRFSRRFEAAGTFEYRCTLHPQMTGVVEVRATASGSASTGADRDQPGTGAGSPPPAGPSPEATTAANGSRDRQRLGTSPVGAASGGPLWLFASFVAGAGAGAAGMWFRR